MSDTTPITWRSGLARRPGWAAAVVGAITLGAIWCLPRFQIDPDVSALFPEDHEAVQLFQATQAGERASRTLFMVIRGEDLNDRLDGLLEDLTRSPFLVEVAGTREDLGGVRAEFMQTAPAYFLPAETLDSLERRLTGEGRREAIRESRDLLAQDPLAGRDIVLRDPLGLRWILDEATRRSLPESFDANSSFLLLDGGRVALVRVVGARDPFDVEFSRDLLADLEHRVASTGGIEAQMVGGYAIAREDAARIKGDLRSSLRWSIPLILLFLAASTRSALQPFLYVAPIGLAVLWSLAYGGLLLGPLTPLAVSSAAILIGLGLDFAIHHQSRFREERGRLDLEAALERTQRVTARPLLGGMLTSAAAFLSVGFASFPGLRSFGLLLALGLVLALFSTWIVLPLLQRLSDRPRDAVQAGPVIRAAAGIARSRAAAPLAYGLIALAALGWGVLLVRGLRFDADPALLRPADSALTRAARELEGYLGFAPLGVTVLVPEDVSLETLNAAAESLRAAGKVAWVTGPQMARPLGRRLELARQFRERTEGWLEGTLADLRSAGFRPGPFREGLEELAALLSADPGEPPDGDRMLWRGERFWRTTFHPPRDLTQRVQREEFHAELHASLGERALIVDPRGLADELGPLLAADVSRSVLGCLVAVLLLVWASVGTLRAGLVALVPVACGMGITLGLVSLLGWPVHPGNFVAIPLILGLGVDDGIHMVSRSREGAGNPIATTGVAVWRTSVTTALGFGSLVTAESPAIASLGAIVLVGSLVCFVATVLLVPYLLRRDASN